ncbi:MAG: aldo/keto reductase [Candidatus Thorarchaeota archaeon]
MQFKELGRTGLKVSELGIGTEHLFGQTQAIVDSVIVSAIENKINYFDILFSVQHYLKKLAFSLKNYRDDLIIAGHLGTIEIEGRPKKNRNLQECEKAFLRMLSILGTEYVDILNIQFVGKNELDKIMKPKGLLDMAKSFQDMGKAKYLGLSTHDINVARRAIKSGSFDMIMFPINIANHGLPGRTELLEECLKNKVGLVAIKPFAAGRILMQNKTVSIAKYQTGGLSLKQKIPKEITPCKCISYIKSLQGVSLILMGVKNVEELNENVSYYEKPQEELDYAPIIEIFRSEA